MEKRERAALAAGGLLLAAAQGAALAQPAAGTAPPVETGWGGVFELGAEFGGDHAAYLYFSDDSDQTIDTGDGVTVAGGLHYRTPSNWDFRGTLGYKYVTTKADNADIYIGRFVTEVVADYFFAGKWHLGAGLSYHSGTQLHGDGYLDNVKFDSALGTTVEIGWSFIALTYTFMDYQDEYGYDYDASNAGVTLIGRF